MSITRIKSTNLNGPLSTLTFKIKAGTRASPAAHLWKHLIIRSTPESSITKKVREFELRGDTLASELSREYLTVTSTFLRDNLQSVVPQVLSLFNSKQLQIYQLRDTQRRMDQELPTTFERMQDGLHHVAFRRGLGAPLYTAFPFETTFASLNAFKDTYINTEHVSIQGENVDETELLKLLEVEGVKGNLKEEVVGEKSVYYGGEERMDTGVGSIGYLGLGFKAPAVGDKQSDACQVLKYVLHGKASVKYGDGTGVFKQSAGKVDVDTFYNAYSDTGLFGLYLQSADITALKEHAKQALKKLENIKAGSLTTKEVEAAIKAVKVNGGTVDTVTVEQVVQLVKGFGKMSVSCVGPDELPWADELN